jgi:OFA family oxalate/formate antiporter-like MFS transporter
VQRNENHLHKEERLIRNPWFQLVASVIAMVMIANLQYAWTLFTLPIVDAHGWKLADVQGAFAIFILFQTWIQPLDGWFIDKLGPRVFITIAGVLCGVGWSAMGLASTLPQLYFFYVLAGIGAAFVYSGCVGSAVKWFTNRRGLAAGIIAAGFGGGTALFIPAITYLIREHSYRDAFLYTGIFQGLVITVTAQFLRHPGPDFAPVKTAGGAKTNARRNTGQFTTVEMLKAPHFYVLYAMFVMMATGGVFLTAQAGPLVRSWGLTATALTAATALSPVANGTSRIFWGWLSDRTGRELAMTIAFVLQSCCLVAVLTLGRTSAAMFTISMVLAFFTWGEVFSLFPATLGDYFGTKFATSNYGVLYSAKGVSAILGGWMAAKIYESFNSWDSVFYGGAVMALAAAVLALVLRARPLPHKETVRDDALVSTT